MWVRCRLTSVVDSDLPEQRRQVGDAPLVQAGKAMPLRRILCGIAWGMIELLASKARLKAMTSGGMPKNNSATREEPQFGHWGGGGVDGGCVCVSMTSSNVALRLQGVLLQPPDLSIPIRIISTALSSVEASPVM